jgi:hypothetical protein
LKGAELGAINNALVIWIGQMSAKNEIATADVIKE